MPNFIGAAISYVGTALASAGIGTGVAYTIGATAVTWSTVFATIIVSAALYGVGQLLVSAPKLTTQRMKEPIRQAVAPRRRAYGRVMVSGVFAFLRERANYLYSLIMSLSQEIDAVEEYWLNDIIVTRDGSGFVISGVQGGEFLDSGHFTAPTDSDGGPYPNIRILSRLGLVAQTAYAELIAAFPGEWTSDHKINGTFHALMIQRAANKDFHYFYPTGPYKLRLVCRAAKAWDPRASGQDPDDPDTWAWTMNGALIVLDYLRHQDGARLPWLLFQNVIADWSNQADICDEEVETLGSGVEPRYQLSGGYEFDAPPRDVLPQMCDPMGGPHLLRMLSDGSVVLRVARCSVADPAVVFTDDQILAYRMRRGLEKADLRNEIRATYTEPTGQFETQETEPWVNQASVDVNGLQSATLDLGWCPSHGQARRRQKMEAFRLDPDWSGEIVVNAYGLDALGEQFIRVQITDLGINEVFEKLTFEADVNTGQVVMQIRSFPAEALEWTAAEEGEQPVVTEIPGGPNVGTPDNLAVWIVDVGGALLLTAACDSPGNGNILQLQVKPSLSNWLWWTLPVEDGGYSGTWPNSLDSGATYDVRARFLSAGGIPGPYVTVSITANIAGYAYRRVVSTDQMNYDLGDDALAHGWDGVVPLFAHTSVDSDVLIGSAFTSGSSGSAGPSFDVPALPATSTAYLTNAGLIYGAAGDGGDHAQNGADGETALRTVWPLSVDNTGGVIAGGGGGGGGGDDPGGGGGGGGRGWTAGTHGAADAGGTNGEDGTLLEFGTGGLGSGGAANAGGDGGDLGEDGQDGLGGTGGIGIGGLAGWCTDGNANITWIANGTRLGALN